MDEKILRQYTKISKKYRLDEGKRKYKLGNVLNYISILLEAGALTTHIETPIAVMIAWVFNYNDKLYNDKGIRNSNINEEITSEIKYIDPELKFYKKFNSIQFKDFQHFY